MATEPKFRPSLTASQLSLIEKMCEQVVDKLAEGRDFSIPELIEINKLYKVVQLFNFKIGNAHTQASYIPTGTAKPKVEIEDLLSESELAEQMGLKGGIDYSSTTAWHTAYKNVRLAESIGGKGTVEDQAASQKWIDYCDRNNLSYDTGEEK